MYQKIVYCTTSVQTVIRFRFALVIFICIVRLKWNYFRRKVFKHFSSLRADIIEIRWINNHETLEQSYSKTKKTFGMMETVDITNRRALSTCRQFWWRIQKCHLMQLNSAVCWSRTHTKILSCQSDVQNLTVSHEKSLHQKMLSETTTSDESVRIRLRFESMAKSLLLSLF